MGGIQAKSSSVAEVHAVRGGQLILRVAPRRSESASNSRPLSRKGSLKSVSSLDAVLSRDIMTSSLLSGASGALYGSRGSFRLRSSSRCYLTEQTMDILEKILVWLSPRDLALLSLTSKTLNFVVRSYLDHFCNAHSMPTRVAAFHETNENLLLPKEVVFRDRLEANRRPQLLLYSARRQYAGLVVRVPFLEVDHFAHKNKNNLIGIERDVQLRREMLIVRSREAKIHMVHTFDHVPPGRYTIQLRLRLTDPGAYATSNRTSVPAGTPPARLTVGLAASNGPRGCSCDANPAEHCDNHNSFRISSNSGGGSSNNNTIVNQVITVKNWCSICDHQHVSQPSLPYMESARVIYDRDSDWFFLRLNTFKLTGASSNLRVEFRDEIQHGWKKHMIWDFIELREVKYI